MTVTGPPVHCRLSVPDIGVRSIVTVGSPEDVRVTTIDAKARGVVAKVTPKRTVPVAGGGWVGGVVGLSQEPAKVRIRASIAALRARPVRAALRESLLMCLTPPLNGLVSARLTRAAPVLDRFARSREMVRSPSPPAAFHGGAGASRSVRCPLLFRLRHKNKNRPRGCPHSVGFAICSPRGIGEPHDVAPRGSQLLSWVARCTRDGGPQARTAPRCKSARAVRTRRPRLPGAFSLVAPAPPCDTVTGSGVTVSAPRPRGTGVGASILHCASPQEMPSWRCEGSERTTV